jgi:alpha-tubulin suppressor-like RCC1 family protein
VAEEQRRELRELEARARAAFKAGDFNGLYAVRGRLRRLRGSLVDERSAALADCTRDLCRAQLARLRAEIALLAIFGFPIAVVRGFSARYLGLGLALAVVVSACAGDETTGPGNRIVVPEAEATYAGTWNVETSEIVSTLQVCASENGVIRVSGVTDRCDGGVTIRTQSGGSLSGSFIIERVALGDLLGDVTATVDTRGSVELSLSIPPGSLSQFEALTGCTSVGGDEAFEGSLSGQTLALAATVNASCISAIDSSVVTTTWTFGFSGTGQPRLEAVDVSPQSVTLQLGTADQLSVEVKDEAGSVLTDRHVTWSTADEDIVVVSAGGLLAAVEAGSTTITATAEGLSATASVTVPSVVFAFVTAGVVHACGATADGVAYCWGGYAYGQLGTVPHWTPVRTPVPVSGGLTFASLDAGAYHTCGLTSSGSAHCWGLNAEGQLGNGSAGGPETCAYGQSCSTTPVSVSGGFAFTSVSAGGAHTCALTAAGTAYCWGRNDYGQLGDNTTASAPTPVPVSGGLTFSELSVGDLHTCGLASGGAYCWGHNDSGQLGDGSLADDSVPRPVTGDLLFQSISAGGSYTCGLTTESAAYCWGSKEWGELGDGSSTGHESAPVPVLGGLTFASLSTGAYHTCAIASDGEAYCWGYGGDGQLGDGAKAQRVVPTPVSGGLAFSAISAGVTHTCGSSTDDIAYCWGAVSGQPVPTRVRGQP